jgi:cytochrome c
MSAGMCVRRYLPAAALLAALTSPLAPQRADGQAAPRPGRARAGHLGIGRPATPEEVARLDIDVMPDGRGLPPGAGTAAQGAAIYAARCAACHGAQGEGTRAGAALVGRTPHDTFDFASTREKERAKTIGSYWPFATTVFDYVRRAMPFDRPGSLTDPEVYAVTAYLLQRNGIVAADAVLDARTLPRVRMPARDRFVRDDREQSRRVR